MNYNYDDEEGIPTLQLALDSMTAEELRKLVALTGQKAPGRKGDMAALIVQHLAGERLRTAWEDLDELQRAAVAEAVHSPSSQLNAGSFRAKYGGDPDWGSTNERGYDRKPSRLCLFLHKGGEGACRPQGAAPEVRPGAPSVRRRFARSAATRISTRVQALESGEANQRGGNRGSASRRA